MTLTRQLRHKARGRGAAPDPAACPHRDLFGHPLCTIGPMDLADMGHTTDDLCGDRCTYQAFRMIALPTDELPRRHARR